MTVKFQTCTSNNEIFELGRRKQKGDVSPQWTEKAVISDISLTYEK
jgi:hypothetical protein